jgi:hypothetical protein
MIDNPDQVERLVAKLRESLPLFATVTSEVAAVIREQSSEADLSRQYTVTRVDYAGDEGGIMCKVELGPENDDRALFASITHLRFGHAGPGDVPRVVENGEAGAAIVRLRSFSMLSSRCLMFSRGEL